MGLEREVCTILVSKKGLPIDVRNTTAMPKRGRRTEHSTTDEIQHGQPHTATQEDSTT